MHVGGEAVLVAACVLLLCVTISQARTCCYKLNTIVILQAEHERVAQAAAKYIVAVGPCALSLAGCSSPPRTHAR